MKHLITIFILTLFACGQVSRSDNARMKISFELIPEDFEKGLYTLDWDDTLGQAEGYSNKMSERPKELWCVVTNNRNDTLAEYTGLSTAMTHVGFQSEDTILTLNFMIGLNYFTDKFETGQSESDYAEAARTYSEKNRLPVIFEPIRINLKTDLRKKMEIELKEK